MLYSCCKFISGTTSGSLHTPLEIYVCCNDMVNMLQRHIFLNFWPGEIQQIMCQVVAYRRLKTIENFEQSAVKVVAVAHKRWSLTRDTICIDLTWKRLVWSHMRGGRKGRFDVLYLVLTLLLKQLFHVFYLEVRSQPLESFLGGGRW